MGQLGLKPWAWISQLHQLFWCSQDWILAHPHICFDGYQYQVAQRFPAHRTVHPMVFWSISSWLVRFYFGAMDQGSRRGLRLGMDFWPWGIPIPLVNHAFSLWTLLNIAIFRGQTWQFRNFCTHTHTQRPYFVDLYCWWYFHQLWIFHEMFDLDWFSIPSSNQAR